MLQSCVGRLRRQWPRARIEVVCHAPERLAVQCPEVHPVGPTWADRPLFSRLPRKMRLGGEQAYKALAPLAPMRAHSTRAELPSKTLCEAICAADVVVAAGGGYLCDPFWWHGLAVLTALRAAQLQGKPTAMFGQGIGPLSNSFLRKFCAKVMSRLDLLTLRERVHGIEFLRTESVLGPRPRDVSASYSDRAGTAYEMPCGPVVVTGDDALVALTDADHRLVAKRCNVIGVNVRVSRYSGLEVGAGEAFAAGIWDAAKRLDARVIPLPVSNYPVDADLPAIRSVLSSVPASSRGNLTSAVAFESPRALIDAVAKCRVVVTGSYHAAVFAVGSGVPVVALSASKYYDAKFSGLLDLYPGLLRIESLNAPCLAARLSDALDSAWCSHEGCSTTGRLTTDALVASADTAFAGFAARVNSYFGNAAVQS